MENAAGTPHTDDCLSNATAAAHGQIMEHCLTLDDDRVVEWDITIDDLAMDILCVGAVPCVCVL